MEDSLDPASKALSDSIRFRIGDNPRLFNYPLNWRKIEYSKLSLLQGPIDFQSMTTP